MRLTPTPRAGMFAALAACAALLAAFAPAAGAGRTVGIRSVIVQASTTAQAAELVAAAGGTVTRPLPIVSGVAADVSAVAAARLARHPAVRAVTPNDPVHVAEATSPVLANDSTLNHVLHREVNADRLWGEGVTGAGVTVALVDTGVSAVAGLEGRVLPVAERRHLEGTAPTGDEGPTRCVDFSARGTCRDEFGHGTFMAGLIAGTGPYPGIAPAADILSVKIAGPDGSSDVSKVLAAIQWVVSFRSDYNVKVLNLSLGTTGRRHYTKDPLNHAVQRAWLSGIAVVVSAGNNGRAAPRTKKISKPADDPLVITVGAVDDRQTPAIDDDRSPLFSSTGPAFFDDPEEALAKPDLVAPGARVISLRAPRSTIDRIKPVWHNDRYRRGSGTSMAAAVVSGAAALVLDANETWSPNRVKWAMTTTARKVAERDRNIVGAGLVDAWAAARLPATPPPGTEQVSLLAREPASLAESRGDVVVTRRCTTTEAALMGLVGQECRRAIDGERTAQNAMWDADDYYDPDHWKGSSWYETQWTGMVTGSSWYETTWACANPDPEQRCWAGSSWYGSSWYGSTESATFYGVALEGSSWYGLWDGEDPRD